MVVFADLPSVPAFLELNANVVVSAYILLDCVITGIPVRLLHACHAMLFVGLYVMFTWLWWRVGLINPQGNTFIYATLQYETQPTHALVCVLTVVFVLLPATHFMWFLLQVVKRSFVHAFCYKRKHFTDKEISLVDI